MPPLSNHIYRFGEFTVDAGQRVLLRNGKPLLLAPKVLETLLTLVQNGGRIIEKEELMKRLWPDTFVEESNLTYCIVQLRKTLGDEARHPRYIETIPKRGYRFIVESDREGQSEVITESRVASIAVLPFLDLSPARDQDYFCEGLADELINTLAGLPNLYVDPGLAQAHASRGLVLSLRGEYAEAEREFETALQLNSKLYEAYYYYARAYFSQGRLDQSAELLEQAIAVRPESIDAWSMLGGIYRGQKREQLKKQTFKRCLDVVQNHLEFYPADIRPLLLGATALIELGETERGLDWTRRALELDSEDPNVLYNAACAFCISGELGEAISCLEKSLPFCADRKWLDYDSYLDPLRSLPRFQELLRLPNQRSTLSGVGS